MCGSDPFHWNFDVVAAALKECVSRCIELRKALPERPNLIVSIVLVIVGMTVDPIVLPYAIHDDVNDAIDFDLASTHFCFDTVVHRPEGSTIDSDDGISHNFFVTAVGQAALNRITESHGYTTSDHSAVCCGYKREKKHTSKKRKKRHDDI